MRYINKITNEYLTALKAPRVKPIVVVELLDWFERVIAEIDEDLSISDAGKISINYQQGVRRSCSLTLSNIQGQYIPSSVKLVWMNTKFKIYAGIEVYNYKTQEKDEYLFSQGVYVLTNPEVLRDLGTKTVTLSGVDKFGIFGSETNFRETDGTYLIPEGTTVGKVVRNILSTDRGNGIPFDPVYPIIDSSVENEIIPQEIKKSPNEYFGDILTEIGNMFACDVYYDIDGHFTMKKDDRDAFRQMRFYPSLWDYTDVSPEYFSAGISYDFAQTYNVVKVVTNNSSGLNYETVLKNVDASSPTNIKLIGEKIKYVESSFCFSQERTDDFAFYLLRKYSIVQQAISFQSSFIPHLEVNNIVTLTDSYYNYNQERFVLQSVSIPLSANSLMDIEASNCANIPYYGY